MCATCGCDADGSVTIEPITGHHHKHEAHHQHHETEGHVHDHHHDHTHPHAHGHDHANDATHSHGRRVVDVEQDVLHQNNLLAQRNRGYFDAKNILAVNLVSSPGSGKTTLLEKTLTALKDELSCYVIEGDQQTSNDGDRIHATGTPVVQINTGKGCHLDAHMVLHALQHLKPKENAVMFIENVGNLVCPAMFDLGEGKRVVIASVTEGDDKPMKYPDMFHSSQLCILNKTDLLPYVPFDVEAFRQNAQKVNPGMEIIELSAYKEEGMEAWYEWLRRQQAQPAAH
ncbi:MAG TPA: hydrogenase nickel incorporation protein HypB [Lacibacter sp.]|nr:hydrogenase nickel incorporation protein HypB [Lacibacter sp.]HMO89889.1 hydrogenase nickel incorporation protein HypB [Lacibacter sp.]HMP86748.1 hydrogenase nickel incorporation protein HypB [Lacibacter sp.]